jgi:hypothetical protein
LFGFPCAPPHDRAIGGTLNVANARLTGFLFHFAFPFIDSTFYFCPSYLISRKKNRRR